MSEPSVKRSLRIKPAVNYSAIRSKDFIKSDVIVRNNKERSMRSLTPVDYNVSQRIKHIFNGIEVDNLKPEELKSKPTVRSMNKYMTKKITMQRQQMEFTNMILKLKDSSKTSRQTRNGHRSRSSSGTDVDMLMEAILVNSSELVYKRLLHDAYFVGEIHIVAAINSHATNEIIEMLMCRYYCINVWHDKEGLTFLHIAAKENRCDVMETLIKYQPNLLQTGDRRSRNALHTACIFGHVESVRELIALNVDMDCRDTDGYTPLLWTVEAPLACAIELIDNGADPNITDKTGKSTLFWAIMKGHTALAKEFMNRGIWFDKKSLTPFIMDMSLGLERHPVILDLRPIEDCRITLQSQKNPQQPPTQLQPQFPQQQELPPLGQQQLTVESPPDTELTSVSSGSGTTTADSPGSDEREEVEAQLSARMTRKRRNQEIFNSAAPVAFGCVDHAELRLSRVCATYSLRYIEYAYFSRSMIHVQYMDER
jgi:ankyrin repeat protein